MTLGPTPWRTRQQGEAEALGLLVPKMGRFYQRIDRPDTIARLSEACLLPRPLPATHTP